MRRFFLAAFLVVACATSAVAGPMEDATSAYGRGDYKQAERLLRPLAEQGDAQALGLLGVMYNQGQCVLQDHQEAVMWRRKATEQGDALGQFCLGVLYEHGSHVPQDFVRAHMWYTVSAAASSGDEGKISRERRDFVAKQMTAAQIEKAQEMARRCQQSQFKECD